MRGVPVTGIRDSPINWRHLRHRMTVRNVGELAGNHVQDGD
jgi:hypothetical protein